MKLNGIKYFGKTFNVFTFGDKVSSHMESL